MRAIVHIVSAFLLFAGAVRAQGPAPSSPGEGIKVHGHWVIEVRNPDGSLVHRREFENALVAPATGGSALLSTVLGGQRVPGSWYVGLGQSTLWGDPQDSGVCGTAVSAGPCYLTDRTGFDGPLTTSIGPEGALHLMGQAAALKSGSLSEVVSGLFWCFADKSPNDCHRLGPSGNTPLTRKVLSNPIPVTAGQVLGVSVTLSFSS